MVLLVGVIAIVVFWILVVFFVFLFFVFFFGVFVVVELGFGFGGGVLGGVFTAVGHHHAVVVTHLLPPFTRGSTTGCCCCCRCTDDGAVLIELYAARERAWARGRGYGTAGRDVSLLVVRVLF
jgi:hypothetical protein